MWPQTSELFKLGFSIGVVLQLNQIHETFHYRLRPIERTHVAGAWTERKKMFHGGSFLKLADDDV